MESTALSYQYIAQSFVVFLNATMIIMLGLSWLGSRKSYLALACCAGVVETSRQIPNALLAIYQYDLSLLALTSSLQFFATLLIVAVLFKIREPLHRRDITLLAVPTVLFVAAIAAMLMRGLPTQQFEWIIYSIPHSLLNLMLIWRAWIVRDRVSAGKVFLVAVAIVIAAIRIIIPYMQESDLFYLLYYLENLLFPLLLAALAVLEVEFSSRRIQDLLEEREQSERDLRFILDNSLDVILITDQIGLLRNWNKPAEGIFGYTEHQTVYKMHIDELFLDKDWHANVEQYEEFNSSIEHLEEGKVDVHVRQQEVSTKQHTYRIFVIRRQSELEQSMASIAL